MSNNGWTPERRARQSALIRRWKPWGDATGPKSVSGKAKSRLNAVKHGGRSASVRRLRRVLRLIETFKKPESGETK